MKIKINETGKIETLNLIDPVTNTDYITNFIGNHRAFLDGQFNYDDADDVFLTSQETYDWWYKVVNDQQVLVNRLNDLRSVYKVHVIMDVINTVSCDLEDHAQYVNDALDKAFNI